VSVDPVAALSVSFGSSSRIPTEAISMAGCSFAVTYTQSEVEE
jgi:hypothetical protein